ncbi:MAG: glycerophosphodiester phosphodiesterase [Smithellaceae bacterium]|nr:glycerophosphodiester phosphodiesterase [Smithellaceae bacterium]
MVNMLKIVAAVLTGLVLNQSAFAIDLQGHRGARGLAPENTLPAFATALSVGVTTLELDTTITRDGVVVISHDPTLNPDITRDANGKWLEKRGPAIYSLTLTDLQQYDVGRMRPGTSYAKRYQEQKPYDGTPIPRLADLFALVRKSGNEQVRFNIETKISPLAPDETPDPETFARTLIEAIRSEGMTARVTIQSFDWRTLQVVQRIAPEIPTAYLSAQQHFLDNIAADNPAGSPWTGGFQYREHGSVPRMVKATGGRIWSPYYGDLSAGALREARGLGLHVVVWTVNEPAQIKRMLDLGVDGIISDRPDLARQIMTGRGMTLPLATPIAP